MKNIALSPESDRWINLGGFCFLEHFVLFIIHENRVAIVFSPHFILRPVKRREDCAFLFSYIGETLSRSITHASVATTYKVIAIYFIRFTVITTPMI